MHTILEDALANVKAELAEKRLHLEVNFGARRSRVLGDSVRLQQVFWNILKNAVKFTPEGGRITVSTSLTGGDTMLTLRVTDTGIGMTPDEIGRVFEAFSQGDHATAVGAHRFGGLGLGLAITKMLVEQHGGKIQAFSDGRDKGSAFQVDLPLVREDAPKGSSSPTGRSTAPFLPTALRASHAAPAGLRRILLVEDHAPTRPDLATPAPPAPFRSHDRRVGREGGGAGADRRIRPGHLRRRPAGPQRLRVDDGAARPPSPPDRHLP